MRPAEYFKRYNIRCWKRKISRKIFRKIKNFLINSIDKWNLLWYNIARKKTNNTTNTTKKGKNVMKFRIYHKSGKYFPTYFRTKKEAVSFQSVHGGEIQRKIGGNWVGYWASPILIYHGYNIRNRIIYEIISRKIFLRFLFYYLTNNLYCDIMLLQQKKTKHTTKKGKLICFWVKKNCLSAE